MKKLILFNTVLVFFSLVCPNNSSAQFQKYNSVSLELGGHGVFYSINYERVFLNRERWKIAGDVGLSWYPQKTGMIDFWIPTLITGLISFNQHHLEAGFGHIYTIENPPPENYLGLPVPNYHNNLITCRFGYRYQKPNGRLILKIAYTPMQEYAVINKKVDPYITENRYYMSEFHYLAGISIGYAF